MREHRLLTWFSQGEPLHIERRWNLLLSLYVRFQNRLHEVRNEKGATAVEYGLLVALIAAVIVGTVKTLGGKIDDAFNAIVTKFP